MWKDNRTGLQPGRWPVSVCVLAVLTALLATGGLEVSAQERRPRPKLIIVDDNPRPEVSQTRGDTPATWKNGSSATGTASAVDRSLKPSPKAGDSQSGQMRGSELAPHTKPASPRIPPLPRVPSFPAVDRPVPSPDTKLPVSLKGGSASGLRRDGSPERNTLSNRRSADQSRSGSESEYRPIAALPLQDGKLEGQFTGPRADALRPIPLPQGTSVEGRKKQERANPVKKDAGASETQPVIFVAGQKKDVSANHVATAPAVSAVQPASFSSSELTDARTGGRPLVVVESTASPPVYYGTPGADVPVWQIVGLSVAITLLLALTLLAFSLLLLTMRQQLGGSPGAVIRFEVAQPAGGNFTLPLPMMPPASQPARQEAPLRGPARVADFAEDILGAAALGPILGEKRGEREDKQSEREESILQQIFEDNVALQKKGA